VRLLLLGVLGAGLVVAGATAGKFGTFVPTAVAAVAAFVVAGAILLRRGEARRTRLEVGAALVLLLAGAVVIAQLVIFLGACSNLWSIGHC
jgi:hypothetical protein